jgi:hypothetical protein
VRLYELLSNYAIRTRALVARFSSAFIHFRATFGPLSGHFRATFGPQGPGLPTLFGDELANLSAMLTSCVSARIRLSPPPYPRGNSSIPS